MVRTALLLTTVLGTGAPATAHAQFSARLGGELGFFHDSAESVSTTILTQVFDADFTIADTVAIVAGLPLVELIGTVDVAGNSETEARFRIGNPFVLGYYHLDLELLTLRAGGGFALPFAMLSEDDFTDRLLGFAAFGGATGMHGFQRTWMYWPESLPLVLPSVTLEVDLIDLIEVRGAVSVVTMVPLNDQDTEVFLPMEAGAMVRLGMFGVGAVFGVTLILTEIGDEGRDGAQVSLSPVIELNLLDLLILDARLTVNLDRPAGLSFDDPGAIWAFFLGVHVEI